ncbi:MAG TPA: PKD domain-containing protein [Thermoplasmata archaeon]|nr:PKD domain-containing protein [Thermoplasmata archaeon]
MLGRLETHLTSSWVVWILLALLLGATFTSLDAEAVVRGVSPNLFTGGDPIVIDGNSAFTPENGVVSGSGTKGDPYVIGPWYIPALGGPAVRVTNTDAYFVVRDIQMETTGYTYDATVFSNTANGRIERLNGQGRNTMVRLTRVRDFVVNGSWLPNSQVGVRIEDSSGVTVSGNEIGTDAGIAVIGSSAVTIRDNRISTGYGTAIELRGTRDVVVERNVITEGGIGIGDSGTIAIRDNELRGLGISVSVNVTVENNVFADGGLSIDGTNLTHFGSHSVIGNTINGRPLRYEKGCRDLVVDNESVAQLIVVDCERVRVSNLTLDHVSVGIHLAFVAGATVTSNRFITNEEGIRLTSSTDSVLIANTVLYTSTPVYLERSSRTLVYKNNIANFGVPVDINGSENAWYAPYPKGGNYWSYHTARDYCSGPLQDSCEGGDGVLDRAFTPAPGITDAYPLAEPFGMVGEKPIVSLSWSPQPVPLGEITYFRADGSADPNGQILFWEWDFGDATGMGEPWAAWHIYPAQGDYIATLKITDDQGLTATKSVRVNVTEPLPRPIASFTAPSRGVSGTSIRFDASASSTPKGVIELYDWHFGDGTMAQGRVVDHVFERAGTFQVTLDLRNDLEYSAVYQAVIEIVARIPLTPYSDPSGFSVPVPETWSRRTNVEVEGHVIELVLLAPYDGSFRTNILIDTDVDSTLRESDASLLGYADDTISDIRANDPSSIVTEQPHVRVLGGHGAVVFAVQRPTTDLIQKIALVVSEPHAHYWLLILTTTKTAYEVTNLAFEEMLSGFEITLAPAGTGAAPVFARIISGIAAATIIAALLVGLALWSRSLRRKPSQGLTMLPGPVGVGLPSNSPGGFCGHCGASSLPGAHFCVQCGASFGR